MDMYRPGEENKAAERLEPIVIEAGIEGAESGLSPVNPCRCTRQQDVHVSQAFEKFYWPTLKK
jgi:hypothetical protein